jgi:cobalt-zinc-cadmium efflux system protein
VTRANRLAVVLALNLALVTSLVVVGLASHSLSVLAAGADYLADAAAICVSLLAIWLSGRPLTPKRPNGYPKATTFAALVNGGWLLILCVIVAVDATLRLASGVPHVDGLSVLVVSGIAAVLMLGGALILGGDIDDGDDEGASLNMRSVLLDTAADAAAAAGVAATGGIILATGGLYWLDPIVALVIAVVIGYQASALLKDVAAALRSGSPPTLRA